MSVTVGNPMGGFDVSTFIAGDIDTITLIPEPSIWYWALPGPEPPLSVWHCRNPIA